MAQELSDKIRAAAIAKGIDPDLAVSIAQAESSLRPDVGAKTSSAKGLFGIIDKTWSAFGGKPGQQKDADENIRVGMDIIASNTGYLKKKLGRSPQPSEVYAAHFFGPTGAMAFLSADPSTPSESVFSQKVLNANPQLQGKTTQQIRGMLSKKVGEGSTAVASSAPAPSAAAQPKSGIQRAVYKAAPLSHPMLAMLGPNYQAAMAVSMLADEGEKEGKDEYEESESAKMLAAAPSRPVALAQADLSFQSPFPEIQKPPQQQQPVGMADGGVVHRAGGSSETGERMTPQQIEQLAADQVALNTYYQPKARPSTGMNRNITYRNGEDTGAFLQGMTELPYDLIGAPRDISNMIMTPFGYGVEKPVMGSAFLKEQATAAGIRPPPPTNPTLRAFYGAGELGVSFMNPAGVVRKGVQVAETGTAGVKKAADMLRGMKKPREVPQTARIEPALVPEVQTELAQMTEQRGLPRNAAQAPDPFMGVRPTVAEAQANVAARQAEPLPPPPAEVVVPPEMLETVPVAPPMQASMPTDRPFVGRLDAFIDTIKNPVQLGQLKGQLKGKFRDYDLERVERAFPGMDDKTKLMPDQIKQALSKVHSPSTWVSETLPPKAGAYHQSVDNVWGANLGTTNLYLQQTPEALEANDLLKKAAQVFGPFVEKTKSLVPTPEALAQARALLSEPEILKVVDPELISNLSKSFDRVEKNVGLVKEYSGVIRNIQYGFANPILYVDEVAASSQYQHQPFFKFSQEASAAEREALRQRFLAQGSDERTARTLASNEFNVNFEIYRKNAEKIASQKVQELAIAEAQKHGIALPDVSLIKWDELSEVTHPGSNAAFKQSLEDALEPPRVTVHEATKNIKAFLDPEIKKVGDILYQRGNLYEGRHTGVAGKPYPIGFTRFSEHEATIPGMGEVQGRHFHELQSDLSKDMRKAGTTSGSAAKDQAEYDKLQGSVRQAQQKAMDKLQVLQQEKREKTRAGVLSNTRFKEIEEQEKAIRTALDEETRAMEKRVSILGGRVRDKASYSLQEPFAGFETNPMVRQQLLMKNAIQSSARDGKSFATFPGVESNQPKLYEGKVLPNLRQVVKDLGGEKAGYEVRQIELPPDKDGNPITAWGVVWSPEAAARIVEKGVPFAKGGSVERQPADNRRYL